MHWYSLLLTSKQGKTQAFRVCSHQMYNRHHKVFDRGHQRPLNIMFGIQYFTRFYQKPPNLLTHPKTKTSFNHSNQEMKPKIKNWTYIKKNMCIFLENDCKNVHHGVHIVCVNESGMVRYIGSSQPPPPPCCPPRKHCTIWNLGTPALHFIIFFRFSLFCIGPDTLLAWLVAEVIHIKSTIFIFCSADEELFNIENILKQIAVVGCKLHTWRNS